MAAEAVWSIFAYILIVAGLAGAVIPVLPGPILIWFGALVWAWADGFANIGWGTLTILGILALVAWGSDIVLSTVMSRRAGASWRAILGSIVGGLIGAGLLSALPVLGTILGALLGAIAGMWAVEYWVRGNVQAATQAVQSYISSVIAASLVEMTLALLMVAIFAYQAFL